MDPKQALIDAREHALNGDAIECARALLNYADWVSRGGFVPHDAVTRLYSVDAAIDHLERASN